jgi:hypothetical protein
LSKFQTSLAIISVTVETWIKVFWVLSVYFNKGTRSRSIIHSSRDNLYIFIYGLSQEECAKIREGVPYVKVYRYNLNTYAQSWTVTEIMAREICGLPCGSTLCTLQLTVLYMPVLHYGVILQQFISRYL